MKDAQPKGCSQTLPARDGSKASTIIMGDAMPDGQAYKLPDAPEQEVPADVQAPRLLNAAAWLEVLAALETEFATILGKNASSS